MGFFSNLKNKARRQIAPVMPMAPQPLPRVPVMPQKRRGLAGLLTPTIFGQPIRRDMDFSQMPHISPKDMSLMI